MISAEFLTYIVDQLRTLDGVATRRMFGGAGIYRGQRMFGLVADDTLYFKVGTSNRGAYEAEGMQPFTYAVKGRSKTISSYWQVPAAVIEEPERLADWARAAWSQSSAAPRERAKAGSRSRRRNKIKRSIYQ